MLSTEVKYMAICHAMQKGLYMRMLQMEMGVNPGESGTLLLVDQVGEESGVPQAQQAHCEAIPLYS